ncbi:hypothetical protein GCM10007913_44180 [Devosia yakushimensis]|uniref:Uncharacterized protein n=1 Tax=Devosia yakushimensis TaxID=470028 RepID=A0ABQ5UKX1_9HYPH|nr:hypothetical protein [Devosia yakushimensis]GLQ12485.1 hypothetical protein GCM10007913_44180 [Devosia yakushimensis]
MSNLSQSLRRLVSFIVSGLTPRAGASAHPDSMSLHDWADLPPYHPAVDRAPC